MVKDYFQDIVPPSNNNDPKPVRDITPPPAPEPEEDDADVRSIPINTNPPQPERSIRNIAAPARTRSRVSDMRDVPPGLMGRSPRKSRRWLWLLAIASVLVLAGLLVVALRSTTVSVVPRTHALTFEQSVFFTAYPESSAQSGILTYGVQASDIEDSEPVKAQGTVHAEEKASGQVTIFNEFSDKPLKFVKTTRFQTPEGLIFRAPADITVPGKNGATPGQVTITLVADQPGEKYNVGPVARMTLPGLKTAGDEFNKVYAKADAGFAGGFVGEKPGVAPADLQVATAQVRARLADKARESAKAAQTDETVTFPGLVKVTYLDQPTTGEGTEARVHVKAHIEIPVFQKQAFADAVALASALAEPGQIRIVPKEGVDANPAATTTNLGADPLSFSLVGAADVVWRVDSSAIQQALAGKDKAAFEGIVAKFTGVQEAHARVEPFWKSTFPTDPSSITVKVSDPSAK